MMKNMECPHCQESVAMGEFCEKCGKILPPPEDESHYAVLGYPEIILDLSSDDLEHRFLQLNKRFHPDRFANKTPLEAQFSHDRSSAVNNAYRTLKNPISRAKY